MMFVSVLLEVFCNRFVTRKTNNLSIDRLIEKTFICLTQQNAILLLASKLWVHQIVMIMLRFTLIFHL